MSVRNEYAPNELVELTLNALHQPSIEIRRSFASRYVSICVAMGSIFVNGLRDRLR